MRFLERLVWDIKSTGMRPIIILSIVIGVAAPAAWLIGRLQVATCEAPMRKAEIELSRAFDEIRAAGPLRTRNDPACPIYRNFLDAAGSATPSMPVCRFWTPARHSLGATDIPVFAERIRQLVAEHCPAP